MHHFSVIGYGSPIPGSSEGDGEVHSSIVVLSCSGGTGPEQGDVSHPEPVTGGMEVCRNRYVTSVPVTLHQRDGCSGHTRSTLKATVALWPECGPPSRLPILSSPLLHWEGGQLLWKRQGMWAYLKPYLKIYQECRRTCCLTGQFLPLCVTCDSAFSRCSVTINILLFIIIM